MGFMRSTRLGPWIVAALDGPAQVVLGPKGQMRTSLRRNDTGAGACEILYTTSVRIVTPG